jgi:transcriptional regulator
MFSKSTIDSLIKDLTNKVQALLKHAEDSFAIANDCHEKADAVKVEALHTEAELRNEASARTDEGMRAAAIAEKIGALLK